MLSSTADRTAEDRAHVFRPARAHDMADPIFIAKAEGSIMWDHDGNRYLDFLSQWVFANIGHQHPAMVSALHEQLDTLCNIAPTFGNDIRTEAARLITERAPAGMNKIFFTCSGSEATEHAVRVARLFTGRHKILAAYRSYHGATSTALAVSGDPRRWPGDLATNGVVHFLGPYLYRSSFGSQSLEEERDRALRHLEQVIQLEGPASIAAVFMETVGGSAGVLLPPDGYLQGVRELCDRYGILLILDEVVVAFGRIGRWFGFEHWGVVPDLMIVGKGVASGYAPLGGVIFSDEIAGAFEADRPYPAGGSFSGHLMSSAAGAANMRILAHEGIIEHSAQIGEKVIGPGLLAIQDRNPIVGEVRGLGTFWTMELTQDRQSRQSPTAAQMREIADACRARGILTGTNHGRITIAPPCNTPVETVEEGLSRVEEALQSLSFVP